MKPAFAIRPGVAAAAVVAAMAGALLPATLAARPQAPIRFELGRDAEGEQCAAAVRWEVGEPGFREAARQPYAITCGGVSAARAQGYVEIADDRAPSDAACGAAREVTVKGLGPVQARRCIDARLQLPVVDLRGRHGGRAYHGAAVATAAGPLEAAMRVLAGVAPAPQRPDRIAPSIDPGQLAEPPRVAAQQAPAAEQSDARSALLGGLALIHAGEHVAASRLLNDAISQFPDAPALVRAELRLNAGLADSNIGQPAAAGEHFAIAATLLAAAPPSDVKSNLENELTTYRALDLINQRKWQAAVTMLEGASALPPLRNPVVLAELNVPPPQQDAAASISVGNSLLNEALLVEAQRQRARSLAYLASGRPDESLRALDAATARVVTLQRLVPLASIGWLRADIQRQRGWIQAAEGHIDEAVADFDCAIEMMQGRVPTGRACLFSGAPTRGGAVPLSDQLIASAKIDRASILARKPGADRNALLRDYGEAVDILAGGSGVSGVVSPLLGGYLTLLSQGADKPSAKTEEAYFRALQTIGVPAIARETLALQNVVAAGPGAEDMRLMRNLETASRRLRYEIAATAPAEKEEIDRRERERAEVDRELAEVRDRLQRAGGFRAVNDAPATVAEIRAALRPNEVYFKLVELGPQLFGAVIAPDRSYLYRVATPAGTIDDQAVEVLNSARSYKAADGTTRIRPFKVAAAYDLFKAIGGPAAGALAQAQAIVFDPSGGMRNLPAAILVTDPASVARYKGQASGNDYSQVAFLGARAELSMALSPRSFLFVRTGLAPSRAANPFIGLGQNAPSPTVGPALARQPLALGSNCRISWGEWAANADQQKPVSADELHVAAAELGAPQAPIVTGAAFTDTAVLQRSDSGDLAKYQVIHFATHGIPETEVKVGGCVADVPPSLITSLAAPTPGTADSAAANGLLSFDEVARLDLDANLVVLSACETAASASTDVIRTTGAAESSERTLDGLVRAFITAHARAVMATVWPVPAVRGSEELIGAFYRSGRTHSIGGALRDAQAQVLRQPGLSHPYFWGAFFVYGDGAKSMLSQGQALAAGGAARAK